MLIIRPYTTFRSSTIIFSYPLVYSKTLLYTIYIYIYVCVCIYIYMLCLVGKLVPNWETHNGTVSSNTAAMYLLEPHYIMSHWFIYTLWAVATTKPLAILDLIGLLKKYNFTVNYIHLNAIPNMYILYHSLYSL